MAQDLISFDEIDGVPTMYIRGGSRETASFQCTQEFYDQLVVWVQHLKTVGAEVSSDYAEMEWITSAGAYVDKPGEHGAGTAFDLDEIQYDGGPFVSPIDRHHEASEQASRRRYYAVDAITRATFRWVLDANYNAAHEDHIHQDFGGLPVILGTDSSSDVLFIQGMLNEMQGAGLEVDGVWGPLTEEAFEDSKDNLDVSGDPVDSGDDYVTYLEAVATKAFANEDF